MCGYVKEVCKIKNEGKIFEDDFKKSVPDNIWLKRLNDNAGSFSGGGQLRFATQNECDYLMYDNISKTLYALELKSTKGSLTFWREDFEEKDKKKSFQIKKNQIKGLLNWYANSLLVCGFVFNFREYNNRTFFVSIKDFVEYTNGLDKKSININDVLQMNCLEIFSEKKRTRYTYNINQFVEQTKIK